MEVTLVMIKEDGETKAFPIGRGTTTIGRKDDCELRIPLAEVSRKHAVLIVDDKKVTVRDTGSANGTYVNNQRIREHDLAPGDHVVVGPVVFTVQIDGEPADVKPVKTKLEARKPAAKVTAKPKTPPDEADIMEGAFDGEGDPISELEALTGTDDTTALNLGDSFFMDDE
jgi:pSer/pThr/pTyr-binding forkhead associated (FHA) protein